MVELPAPIRASEYVQAIRPHLCPDAFRRRAGVLVPMFAHLTIVLGGAWAVRWAPPLLWPVFSIIIGHSLGCLGFLAHTMSHGSVLVRGPLRYVLEVLFFGVNAMPPTIWNKIHNHLHHQHPNGPGDPDRPFRRSEATPFLKFFNRNLSPNTGNWRWNPAVLFHFTTYLARQVIAALGSQEWNLPIMPARATYTAAERCVIAGECAAIVALQCAIYTLAGSLPHYLWVGPAAMLISSGMLMAYIFTNHFLNPLTEENDPLIATTSVEVPAWVDLIHGQFSYHTEHHLFPALNPKYYPEVSAILKEKYPERYHRIPIGTAWRMLWDIEEFIEEPPRETSIPTEPGAANPTSSL